MTPETVRQILRDRPELPKEVRLNDGKRHVIRSLEHWLVGPRFLIVLDEEGFAYNISFRNITSIRALDAA